jgi:NADPH:quinone reductase-like Zn-dependent oxidoreductase
MKAFVYTRYGSPDVLELRDVETPTPKDNEVLVRVHATSVNSADLDYLRGAFLVRLGALGTPKHSILGTDIAGRVEAVGKHVIEVQPGDEVYGDLTEYGFGAFAEYVCLPEKALTLKPTRMTFAQAAAIPTAGVIALQGIRNMGRVQSGQRVLINGAGGGVGTFAIQLAKHLGAQVTAVDSAHKLDMLRELGAVHVIDYAREDFTRNGQQYDIILDVVARRSVFAYQRALTPTGIFGMIGGTTSAIFQAFFLGAWLSKRGSQTLGVVMVQPTQDDLNTLKVLVDDGTLKPVIDTCYPFDQLPTALHTLESGQARGKVVVTIVPDAI